MAQPFYSLDLVPSGYWSFACVKVHLWGKQFESKDGINTAVAASSHCLSADEYRAAIDGKSVWTVLVVTLSGGHI
jgi:hypothetical protein